MRTRWFWQALVALSIAAGYVSSPSGTAIAQQYGARPAVDGTVPVDTIINVRMDTTLTSKSAKIGDHFTATVTVPVDVNGGTVIPAGAIVEGHVAQVTPARRMGRSGTIAVEFDDLVLPDGTRVGLDGTLTSDDPEVRRQIDSESRITGRDNRRTGVFVGGGGAIGAVLGGIAGGAKGAVIGGAAGAAVGLAEVLFFKGEEAKVPRGTPFGVQLRREMVIHGGGVRDTAGSGQAEPSDPNQPDSAAGGGDRRARRVEDNRREDNQLPDDRVAGGQPEARSERRPAENDPARQPENVGSSRRRDESQPRDAEPGRDTAPAVSDSSRPVDSPRSAGASSPDESTASVDTPRVEPLPLGSPEMTKRAQAALKLEGYYEGEVTDQWSPRAKTSLKAYQKEHKLAESGELDAQTAKSLGLMDPRPASQSTPRRASPPPAVSESRQQPRATQQESVLANVLSASATRRPDGAIYVLINVQANTGGWRWHGDHVINGDTLEVYARAVGPTGVAADVLTRGKIELNITEGVEYVRRVVVHSSGPDQAIVLDRSSAPSGQASRRTEPAAEVREGSPGTLGRAIQAGAADLLAEFKKATGMGGGQRNDSSQNDSEVELLFALNSFSNAANLYSSLIDSLQSSQSRRQATLDLARQARRADRIITVSTARVASDLLPHWDVIRQDVLRLMRLFSISTAEIEN